MGIREQVAGNSDWMAVRDSAAVRHPAQLRVVDRPSSVALQADEDTARADASQRFAKRWLDLAVAIPLLVLLAPLLLAAAIAVRLDSRGPALFRQLRLGLNGKPFRILKLRTLTVAEDGDSISQVTRNDPRVTRVGGILRRFSFDELPQLINVVRGEMSLVGPRPHALAHDRYFALRIESYELRQNVKPGITGWAQIHGLRGETATLKEMRRRVGFDLWYVRHAGFGLDLRILLFTPGAVLRGRNAW